MTTTRRRALRSALAALAVAGTLALGACSDDDNDGNPEIDVPEDVDVEVDQGEDKPGD